MILGVLSGFGLLDPSDACWLIIHFKALVRINTLEL